MDLSKTVSSFATKHRLLAPSARVLVAVSGGPDSVALLHLLCDLRDELNLHLEVAHLQHGIRGAEAKADARFVGELADKLHLPFHLKEVDLPRMKRDAGKGNLEALARVERYGFFAEVVRKRGLDKVATAHTRDDQAETMLMWFLRGAGPTGLSGMAPRQKLKLVGGESTHELTVIRPMLEISKAEVLGYLSEKQLAYCVDKSNQDPKFLRNWIRTELLPKIGRRIDPHVPERLGRLAELLRDEDNYLDEVSRRRFAAMLQTNELARPEFLAQPKALQRRILRLWVERAQGHLRGLEFVHIDDMLRLIDGDPPQGRSSIPGGWELVREYESLRLQKRVRSRRGVCYNYPLKVGVILRVPEANLEFHSELVTTPPEALPGNLMEAVFDLGYLNEPLWVRNFRHGDRFQPLGMTGHKKIKDLFIEKRVPLSIRSRWPLLLAGDEILWIPGYGRSAAGAISERTAAILHFKVLPD